ncbi:hypothetical protein ILUMI_02762 [Ignelater luminosus]|uniref:Uncharacterized protein n=1 Tax=Ignelater luminosus TaxID=2038154 RepID=A0A8K0DH21_IGNLU|nr:hypothetical protein ILUMI_02762 [Ignelater luminosus]
MSSRGKLLVQLAQNLKSNDNNIKISSERRTYAMLTPVPIGEFFMSHKSDIKFDFPSSFRFKSEHDRRDAGSSLYIDEPSTSNFQKDISSENDTSDLDWSDIEDSTYSPDYESEEHSDSSKNDLGFCSTSVSTANPHDNLRKDAEEDREGEKYNVRSITENSRKLTRKTKEILSRGKEIFKKTEGAGKEYLTQNGKLKRGPNVRDIDCKCHYKCTQFFSREQRQQIFKDFLQLMETQKLRWKFISKQVFRNPKKRSYSENVNRRTYSYVYNLISNNTSRQVCQKFFLATLDISIKTVKTAITKLTQNGTTKQIGVLFFRIIVEVLQKESTFHQELGVVPEKHSYYRHIFTTKFNYGFHRPKEDQCDFCTKHATLNEESKTTLQEDYDLDLLRKPESRDHKESDKESEIKQ